MSRKKQPPVWGSHLNTAPAEANVQFCAGRDVLSLPMADQVLLPYDIWTNQAHCIMLYQQGIIERQTLAPILGGLKKLTEQVQAGTFALDPKKEDVHINVEAFITENHGVEIGGVMHTGRSRNDQAACDMRLYLRDAGIHLASEIHGLGQSLLEQARYHADSPMPGFTHYQPAMITTWGHWLCSYVQAFCRDLERMELALRLVNRNPLGAAAAFGTSWTIDRQATTRLLGFDRVDTNTLDCITARWENEAQLAQTYGFVMNHLSVMAQDLIFLSLPYIQMIRVDEAYVTGSSIMPQKKNPDFAEVIKSKASLTHGLITSLMGIQKGGLSGYNRDTQMTKYLIMDIIRECESAPLIMKGVFETLHVNQDVMEGHCQTGYMNAVDIADYLARELKLSFRQCYQLLALAVKYSAPSGTITQPSVEQAFQELGYPRQGLPDLQRFRQPGEILALRRHQGSPAPEFVMAQIDELSGWLADHFRAIEMIDEKALAARQLCNEFIP